MVNVGRHKILLLSDIPPCSNYTGGVVLADQCRSFEPQTLCAFVVLNPALEPRLEPDLAWIPILSVEKPNEQWGEERGTSAAIEGETYNATVRVAELVAQAADFARAQAVTAVWAVLEGQTVVRMALPLSQQLGVSLYCQVWDPLSWWLGAHWVDSGNRQTALEAFDRTIEGSQAVATASWAMADYYTKRYGVRCLPVINNLEAAVARPPSQRIAAPDRVTIGMVGQFYARDAWACFVQSLNEVGWRLGRRDVYIYYLGQQVPTDVPADRLINGGWMAQPKAVEALSWHTDLCYCPYPFDPAREEVARFSFPSKSVMYLAAGRPVFCHAPWYSSPARYLAKEAAGVVCGDLDAGACGRLLRWFVEDEEAYAAAAANAQRAFLEDFTRDRMYANFHDFLETGRKPYR